MVNVCRSYFISFFTVEGNSEMNKKLDLILTELQGQKRSINYLKDQNDQALAMCDQTSHLKY